MEQLMLFEETKEEMMLREIKEMKDSANKVRKSQFAKISTMTKIINDLKAEHETFLSAMCRGAL